MADFQSIGNSESCRDMLNSLVTGAAIMWAAAFKNMGSRPSRPADLFVLSLVSSFWTSEVERGIKEKSLLFGGESWTSAEVVTEVSNETGLGFAIETVWVALIK